MFSYESGLVVAFLMWLWHAVMLITSINSRMERNLNRIGQRLSWLTLTPKPLQGSDRMRTATATILKYFFIIGLALPFIFLSWLYVFYVVAALVYRWAKSASEPQSIKEFRWKLRYMDMTFDQLARELMKISGDEPDSFPQFREKLIQEMRERELDPS